MREYTFILGFLCATHLLLTAIAVVQKRLCLSPEVGRKLLHAGIGLILTPLPFVFDHPRPVAILCACYFGLLMIKPYIPLLKSEVGPVMDGVARRSLGPYLFPLATLALFLLARQQPALFVGPMLMLALADAAAAVIGQRYGLCPYAAPAGRKTLEGSLAFAAISFAAIHFSLLLLGDVGRVQSVLIALCVAVAMTLVEAVSVAGLDNLLVPLGTFFLTRALLGVGQEKLAIAAAGVLGVATLLTLVYAIAAAPREPAGATEAEAR